MALDQRVDRLEQAFADLIDLHRKDGEILGKMADALSFLAESVNRLEKGQEAIRSELTDTRTVLLTKLETVEFDLALVKGILMPDPDEGEE